MPDGAKTPSVKVWTALAPSTHAPAPSSRAGRFERLDRSGARLCFATVAFREFNLLNKWKTPDAYCSIDNFKGAAAKGQTASSCRLSALTIAD